MYLKNSGLRYTFNVIFSIAELMCCCQVTGVVSFAFIIAAENADKRGDFLLARRLLRSSTISLALGPVISVLIFVAKVLLSSVLIIT